MPYETPIVTGVAPGFEGVAAAFDRVLATPGERGAAFAASRRGALVVDLFGGTADSGDRTPWTESTSAVIFSGTKGLAALCLLLLWQRGKLDDRLPVAEYWPEFAAGGKRGATVGHALTHTAGVPGLRVPYSFETLLDQKVFAALVAAEPAFTPPGSTFTYHAKTFGAIGSELIRRAGGRTPARFFSTEFASPLRLDTSIGLPRESRETVAWLSAAEETREAIPGPETPWETASRYDPPSPDGGVNWNRPESWRAGVLSSGAISTARSMARLYQVLVPESPESPFTRPALDRAMRDRAAGTVFGEPMAVSSGFYLGGSLAPSQARELGAVGHPGAGGSVHGAWPDLGISFSFLPNTLRSGSDRSDALLSALYAAATEAT